VKSFLAIAWNDKSSIIAGMGKGFGNGEGMKSRNRNWRKYCICL